MKRPRQAFTLAEMLVSITVLSIIVLSISRLISNVEAFASLAGKRSNCAQQARFLLDRISVDFAQMLRRNDIDYFLKTPVHPQPGNDQIAFFSMVPGYSPSTISPSPISLVGYRISNQGNAERLGKGLPWNGASSGGVPLVFLPQTIGGIWPAATNNDADTDYEIAAPNVFRFEYFYWLRTGMLSETPWDIGIGHTSTDGMRDVVAVSMAIATIDSRTRLLISNAQLTSIATRLTDFTPSADPGTLATQWQEALTTLDDVPASATAGIRIYQRAIRIRDR
jgi:prepilin-type N-terminal cleavage/methylation domain-containing protein